MEERKISPIFLNFKLPSIYATILKTDPEHQGVSRTLNFLLSKGLNTDWIFISPLKAMCDSLAIAEVLPLSFQTINYAGQG